jgi:hypothetical protein
MKGLQAEATGYFIKMGVDEIINIQPKGGKSKPYQVKQVRSIILKFKLIVDGE